MLVVMPAGSTASHEERTAVAAACIMLPHHFVHPQTLAFHGERVHVDARSLGGRPQEPGIVECSIRVRQYSRPAGLCTSGATVLLLVMIYPPHVTGLWAQGIQTMWVLGAIWPAW